MHHRTTHPHFPHINTYRSAMLSLARRRGLGAVASTAVRPSAAQLLYPPLLLPRRSTSSILPDAAAADDADIATPVVRMYTADGVDAAATPAVRMLQRVEAGVPTAEYLEGGQLSPDSIPTRMIEIPCPFSHGGPRQYETVKVAVIQDTTCANYWCSRLAHVLRKESGPDGGGGAMGLDLEWKPTFRARQAMSRAAVLQLSGPGLCLVIQLQQLKHIPRQLRQLLADPTLLKVGVSVDDDLAKLRHDWGVASSGYVDVGRVGGRIFFHHCPFRTMSVQNMAASLWGIQLPKSDAVRLGNWEHPELSTKQVEYAALDAMAGRAIYQEFYRRGLLDRGMLEEMMQTWLVSTEDEDRKRARSLALESDALRRVYTRLKGESPSKSRSSAALRSLSAEKPRKRSTPRGKSNSSSSSSKSRDAPVVLNKSLPSFVPEMAVA